MIGDSESVLSKGCVHRLYLTSPDYSHRVTWLGTSWDTSHVAWRVTDADFKVEDKRCFGD